MPLTIYGKKEILIICIISILFLCASICFAIYLNPAAGYGTAFIITVISIGLLAFFRDPKRTIPLKSNVIVAPADGVIRDIEIVTDSEENFFFDGNEIIRIGIFLSVLDVHINRTPCDIKVKKCVYRKGKYHDARHRLASKENEAMTIFGVASVEKKKFPLIVRQISGAIARRIVCTVHRGAKLKKGAKFGMIKFGSRTELFLPKEEFIQIETKVGDRVFAGETVLAKKL